MADLLLLALQRNLAQAEQLEDEDRAKALKKRLAEREAELGADAEEAEAEAEESAALADKNMTELRKLAADAEIEGRSGMDKDELVAALAAFEEE